MEKLLGALAGMGYVRQERRRYALAALARKWLLEDSSRSLHDAIVYQAIDGGYIAQMEQYVRTGAPLRIHEDMKRQRLEPLSARNVCGCGFSVAEVARRIPVRRNARTLLDIGGGHGRYAVALRESHPQVRATILDLPNAVRHAAPLVARSDLSDRITYRVGDALAYDLGEDVYDIVIINNLVHHFDEEANRALTRRVAQALRPGGVMAIGEVSTLLFEAQAKPGRRADRSLLRADEQSGHVVLRRDGGLAASGWTGSQKRRAAADRARWWTPDRPQNRVQKEAEAAHDVARPRRSPHDGAGADDLVAGSRALGG